ncbi:MAG: hybrid sensor histidine kinase/response regulator [Candidatus Kapabacteria bacterium]|nr:hybrid sensor histidine kinase/response regulator [Candidatus Kapabacteria bacterium]
MSNEIDMEMLDLFRLELESHTKTLEIGLINLEKNSSPQNVEPLMRAAHSIKGAARIVGLDKAVDLAHSMEDILDAVMKKKRVIDSADIEVLLECNDFYTSLLNYEIAEIPNVLNNSTNKIKSLIDSLNALPVKEFGSEKPKTNGSHKAHDSIAPTNGSNKIEPKEAIEIVENKSIEVVQTQSEEIEAAAAKDEQIDANAKKTDDRFVRVLSDRLNKILGLTGEILVQTKLLRPFGNELQILKNGIIELNTLKESIYQELQPYNISEEINENFRDASKRMDMLLSELRDYIDDFDQFSRRLEILTDRLYNEAIDTRMKPFSEGLAGFPRLVRDISKKLGKKVEFKIRGESTRVDRDILEKLEAPLNHLIRNAIDHGIEMPDERASKSKNETGTITLEARHLSGMLMVFIEDDGKGMDPEYIRKKIVDKGFTTAEMAQFMTKSELFDFLFLPGFSTATEVTEISGRGVGLDVVFSMVHEVGGMIRVDSEPNKGTIFQLQLPLTLSVLRSLLVEISGEPYAIPLSRIERIVHLSTSELKKAENHYYCELEGENIGIVDASQIFGIQRVKTERIKYPIVVVSDRLSKFGMSVDRFISQTDLVVIPINKKLGRIQNISSGAILEDGTPVLITDVDDLVRSIDVIIKSGKLEKADINPQKGDKKLKHILVVDDSITVREVERKLLENKGFKVTVAVDGIDGWNTLHRDNYDLVISDIDMPRMNGIEMVKRIKNDIKYRDLPIMIVSYKDREDDKKAGLSAGASYYLTKSSFHDNTLLNAVYDLIGTP